ncbi:poly adp-ribose polymerase member 14-like protein [Stylonychia lemnae]|uniref:Poly [ADP-ribose] polymerase n=1 Tax=Stylonychia lemnae TaxID=5949 RepID=A0A078ABV7_STYLE|nr:poly adp-ribose polymerase member 14-like protein [Stylonychia lemnae]|eukprot:CDW79780.1 poly adp-ribose polymerase member 14-like protein [Stylonychia lemnae]
MQDLKKSIHNTYWDEDDDDELLDYYVRKSQKESEENLKEIQELIKMQICEIIMANRIHLNFGFIDIVQHCQSISEFAINLLKQKLNNQMDSNEILNSQSKIQTFELCKIIKKINHEQSQVQKKTDVEEIITQEPQQIKVQVKELTEELKEEEDLILQNPQEILQSEQKVPKIKKQKQIFQKKITLDLDSNIAKKLGIEQEIWSLKKQGKNIIKYLKLNYNQLNATLSSEQESNVQKQELKINGLKILSETISIKDAKPNEDLEILRQFFSAHPKMNSNIYLEAQSRKSEGHGFNRKEAIIIYCFEKYQDQLQDISQKLEKFISQEMKQEYQLFNVDNYIDRARRELYYEYLQNYQVIEDILLKHEIITDLSYSQPPNLSITGKFSKNQFEKIVCELIDVQDSLNLFKIQVPCDFCFVSKTQFQKQGIQDQIIEKYQVLIKLFKEINGLNIYENQTFYIDVAYEGNIFNIQEYVIVGDHQMVNDACDHINQIYNGIFQERIRFEQFLTQNVKKEFNQKLLELSQLTKAHIKVINVEPLNVWVISDQQRILEDVSNQVKQLITTLKEKDDGQNVEIKVDQAFGDSNFMKRIFELKQGLNLLHQLQEQYQLEISYSDNKFTLVGGRVEDKKNAEKVLRNELAKLKELIIEEEVRDPDLIWTYEQRNPQYWENLAKVKISLELRQQMDQQPQQEYEIFKQKARKNYIIIEETLYQWSYKVFPTDHNYSLRTDLIGNWFDFDSDQNDQIEAHYQYCVKSNMYGLKYTVVGDSQQKKNGFQYHVYGKNHDSSTWFEENTQTKRVRPLNRRVLQTIFREKYDSESEDEELKEEAKIIKNNNLKKMIQNQEVLVVKGLKEDIQKLLSLLQSYYDDPENHPEILKLKQFSNLNIQNIKQELSEYFNKTFARESYIFEDLGSGTQIKFIGKNASQIKSKAQELLNGLNQIKFPPYWQNVVKTYLKDQGLDTYIVPQLSKEFKDIYATFAQYQMKVLKIKRIQNKGLWYFFQQEALFIRKKNQKEPIIKDLFHGTTSNKPSMIYKSQDSLDVRFSQRGMWGFALYFTESLGYIDKNGYSYKSKSKDNTPKKKVFMAKVLLGESKKMPPYNDLRFPPLMPGETTKRYDSITGNTKQTQVYMIYGNRQVYVEYVIKYVMI